MIVSATCQTRGRYSFVCSLRGWRSANEVYAKVGEQLAKPSAELFLGLRGRIVVKDRLAPGIGRDY